MKRTAWRLACWAPFLLLVSSRAMANRAPQPSERFALADYDVFEIKRDVRTWGGYVAWIIDPTGFENYVVPGNYIGRRDGKVTRISRCRMYVTELLPDGQGGWVEAFRSMRSRQYECRNEKSLPTDVAYFDPKGVPEEVAKRLAPAGLSGYRLVKELDSSQFTIWTILAKEADYSSPGAPRAGKLVVFHKKSRTVDIISDP